jgi:hypothetical protein
MPATTSVSENDGENGERNRTWTRKIWDAQQDRISVIAGRQYERVPYGREGLDWNASTRPCHDCAVTRGQLHVPGCDVERCPACRGQMISCGCVEQ